MRGGGAIHWLNNNHTLQVSENVASGTPTNTDTWNDKGNYSTTAPQGSGTEADPYLISTAEELAWISVNYSGDASGKYFRQTANIDLGAHYWVPINNVSNISSSNNQRAYYYDGDNHTISNLFIDISEISYRNIGLFGLVYGSSNYRAYIKNLGVVNGNINAELGDALSDSMSVSVGTIIGQSYYTDIINCYNDNVNVNGDMAVGGIVGDNRYGDISNCYNTGDVIGGGYVGGISGFISSAQVSSCYNSGNIAGKDGLYESGGAGGIVGYGNRELILNCYNTGNVAGVSNASAGIAIGASVSYSYNTGIISDNDSLYAISNRESVNSYYCVDTGNMDSYATGVSYQDMMVTETGVIPTAMAGLISIEHDDVWLFKKGTRPLLNGVGEGKVENYSLTWDGNTTFAPSLEDPSQPNSEDNPYIIDSAAKLAWISANFDQSNCYGQHYLQTVNIDLASHPWTPINNTNGVRAYYYDGGNHTISNLYINTSEQTLTSNNYLGLFGYVYGSSSNHAYIKNLGIVNGSIAGEGSRYVGAVVGRVVYTDITNCYNEKTDITMTGSSNYVGGVVGYNDSGTISGSYNTGTVSGSQDVGGVAGGNYGIISGSYNDGDITGSSQFVGGVAGYNHYGIISSSYNTGVVSGGNYVGGVVGYIQSGTISSSYSTGTVSGGNYVGGVAGRNSYGTISGSYNTGTVSGSGYDVGGVVGDNSSGGTISGSYNTGTVSGSGNNVGGVAGDNSGTISSSYNTGTVSGVNRVGGVVGYIQNYNSSNTTTPNIVSISSCFNTGAVTRTSGSSTYFGGVVGYVQDGTSYPEQYTSISWCYYNSDTVGSVVTKAIGRGTGYQVYGLTTAQMQGDKNQNYMYLSDTVWNFASGSYPTLKYVATAQN